jgi:hypothetical protein
MEILLKEIDFVVLLNGLLGSTSQVLSGLREPESGISVKFFLILSDISRLGVVELLWPTYFKLFHMRHRIDITT